MFKKTLLALTALSAISLLPYTVATPAGAAVKIKPAAVKIKAKIKPKIRATKVRVRAKTKVRVKAAKVRIKKRVKLRKVRAAKLRPVKLKRAKVNVKKVKIKTVKVKPKAKPKLKVKLARKNPALKTVKLAKPIKVGAQTPRPSAKPGKTIGQIAIIGTHARFTRNAINAARAAEAARNVIGLGNLRAGAPSLGLATPELTNTGQAHRTLTPPGGGQPDNPLAGNGAAAGGTPRPMPGQNDGVSGGADALGGLANSHNRDAPSTGAVAVNTETLTDGIANTGGGSVTLPVHHNQKESMPASTSHSESTSPDMQTAIFETTKHRQDGTSTSVVYEYGNNGGYRRVIETDNDGRSTTTVTPTELHDPDYVGGGSTCNNVSCIIGAEKPKGLTYKESKNHTTPGGLPPAPEDSNHTGEATAPLYTANDVLERYDPDAKDNGSGSRGKDSVLPGGFPEDPNG